MSEPLRSQRIGIVGLGVLGGALARSLRASEASRLISAYSTDPADTDQALREGVIDVVAPSSEECVSAQDVVIYATPLDATVELVRAHTGLWGDAVVTDVASLKAPVMEAVRHTSGASRFMGSHPIAGSEGSGFGQGSADLFVGAPVWITPGGCASDVQASITALWKEVGARPQITDAGEHDARMVWISHTPQLLANALARTLQRAGISARDLGAGGRDMTRLAASAPEMWNSLLTAAAADDAAALRKVAIELEGIASSLEAGDFTMLTQLMRETQAWRGEV